MGCLLGAIAWEKKGLGYPGVRRRLPRSLGNPDLVESEEELSLHAGEALGDLTIVSKKISLLHVGLTWTALKGGHVPMPAIARSPKSTKRHLHRLASERALVCVPTSGRPTLLPARRLPLPTLEHSLLEKPQRWGRVLVRSSHVCDKNVLLVALPERRSVREVRPERVGGASSSMKERA